MDSGARRVTDALPVAIGVRVVGAVLLAMTLGLSLASYAMHLVTRAAGADTVAALDVGDEVSLATWFETLLFVLAALVLLLGARRAVAQDEPTRGWTFLAVVMVALSIDEAVSVHERLGSALRDLLDTSGVLYYVWVVPAVAFAGIVALVQLGWLRSLPARTRYLVLLSGVVFVAGAGGLEVLAGLGDEVDGTGTLTSISLSALEELAEMLGLTVFVVALLDHLVGSRFTLVLHRP